MENVSLSIPFTPQVMALFAIIAQGVFAALIVYFAPNNRKANRFLALLLFIFALWMMDSFYRASGIYQQDPDFYFQPIFYSFAFGPLLFFYVKALTNNSFALSKTDYVHFFPALLQGGLYWFLFFQNYDFRRWFWFEVHYPYTYSLEFDLTLVSMFIYLIFSIQLLNRYKHWLADNFSEFSKINLYWLRIALWAMGILCLAWGIDIFMQDVLTIDIGYNLSEYGMAIILFALAIGSLTQMNLQHLSFQEKPKETSSTASNIDQKLMLKIEQAMVKQELFLHPELSLKQFAEALGEPARRVSEHINQGIKKSFVDFVNTFRVKEVIRKMESGALKQHTLLAIGLDSGFNSKSTFNRVFKKHTGKSPKEYQQVLQNKY